MPKGTQENDFVVKKKKRKQAKRHLQQIDVELGLHAPGDRSDSLVVLVLVVLEELGLVLEHRLDVEGSDLEQLVRRHDAVRRAND